MVTDRVAMARAPLSFCGECLCIWPCAVLGAGATITQLAAFEMVAFICVARLRLDSAGAVLMAKSILADGCRLAVGFRAGVAATDCDVKFANLTEANDKV